MKIILYLCFWPFILMWKVLVGILNVLGFIGYVDWVNDVLDRD